MSLSNLVILTTDGDLLVAKRSPEKYDELHRYKIADSQTWAHPVLLGGDLITRDTNSIVVWSLR